MLAGNKPEPYKTMKVHDAITRQGTTSKARYDILEINMECRILRTYILTNGDDD
jgi:hypothetical protein